MNKIIVVSSLLIDVEAELRQLNLWQTEPPSAQALASQQPFAIDTLSFPQWLQFVLLVKLPLLLEQQALPHNCHIAPMAEEYFNAAGLEVKSLINTLSKLDDLMS